jgi:Tfp pilus assembly protein PilW
MTIGPLPSPRDETGTTIMEVIVALAAGVVVLAALSTIFVVTLRSSARVSARVDANQRARIALNTIVEQLHSACVAPQVAPIREGSSGILIAFIHQTGSAVSPVPVESKVYLDGTTLKQSDYPLAGGTTPSTWTFALSPSFTKTLMTNVSPTAPASSIFGYYSYTNGQVSATALEAPLNAERAAKAVKVAIAFSASPLSTPAKDAEAATTIKSAVNLRLTPPAFTSGSNLPCQ